MEKKMIYSPEEIAKQLSVKMRTIYSWINKGELKAFKAGRLWRIKRADLESFLGMPIPWEEQLNGYGSSSSNTIINQY